MAEKVVVKPVGHASNERSNRLKFMWSLVCLVGPTALFILTVILAAINNLVFGELAPIRVLMNIVIFLLGLVSILTWLPGMIVGILLLVTRKPVN